MANSGDSPSKAEIRYPCRWEYRLIAVDKHAALRAVKEVVCERAYTLRESRRSKSGKYLSIMLQLTVHSEADRLELFETFRNQDTIIMVL